MALGKRIYNILRFGLGPRALEKKRAIKAERRLSIFESDRWKRDEGIAQRNYSSYNDYVEHQVDKLDRIKHRLHETEVADETRFRKDFTQCEALKNVRSVLCLGARLGTEVKALRALGYFALGIDLNPGKDNPYVLAGDFHQLDFPENCVDAVYTNSLDHAYDLEKILTEVRRVLKPEGIFIAEMHKGYTEGFTPGNYEAFHWQFQEDFIKQIIHYGEMPLVEKRDLGYLRRDILTQVIFRKPASGIVSAIHAKVRREVEHQ
ncbi:MAG: methyltransferase domain-containing protein [Gammaproteobacteria bacterium]